MSWAYAYFLDLDGLNFEKTFTGSVMTTSYIIDYVFTRLFQQVPITESVLIHHYHLIDGMHQFPY